MGEHSECAGRWQPAAVSVLCKVLSKCWEYRLGRRPGLLLPGLFPTRDRQLTSKQVSKKGMRWRRGIVHRAVPHEEGKEGTALERVVRVSQPGEVLEKSLAPLERQEAGTAGDGGEGRG